VPRNRCVLQKQPAPGSATSVVVDSASCCPQKSARILKQQKLIEVSAYAVPSIAPWLTADMSCTSRSRLLAGKERAPDAAA
jgi:hypothetical protein